MIGVIETKYIIDIMLAGFDGYQWKRKYGFRCYHKKFSIFWLIPVSDMLNVKSKESHTFVRRSKLLYDSIDILNRIYFMNIQGTNIEQENLFT